jgi:hypothetical protein
MDSITGFDNSKFQICYELAEIGIIDTTEIRFLHYNHLIASKEQSNRLKDQLDVEELKKIKRKQ